MQDVIPLKSDNKYQHIPQKPKITRQQIQKRQASSQLGLGENDLFTRNDHLETISGDTYLLFEKNLPHKTLRKLRQGQYNPEAELDLHGHTVNEAATALSNFLESSIESEKRVLRIVHGKGSTAILKTQLNTWLREYPAILAFCSAKSKDGGTGAMYVLLRNPNKIRN